MNANRSNRTLFIQANITGPLRTGGHLNETPALPGRTWKPPISGEETSVATTSSRPADAYPLLLIKIYNAAATQHAARGYGIQGS